MTPSPDAGCALADELLPCPFCGSPAKLHEHPDMVQIECANDETCGVSVDCRIHDPSAKDQATKIWNTRTIPGETGREALALADAIEAKVSKPCGEFIMASLEGKIVIAALRAFARSPSPGGAGASATALRDLIEATEELAHARNRAEYVRAWDKIDSAQHKGRSALASSARE
jgi:Restriction alleviation protein Lar